MSEEPIRGDVLEEAERLMEELRHHDDPTVGARLETLLECIDVVHRAGLTHLVSGIQSMAGEAFIHRLCSDPAVRLLLMSYDLVAVDRRMMAEEALDPVRGHLHSHGIDIELSEVVGSVVYVRLHPPPADPDLVERIRKDLETALYEGLPGFQEVEIGDRRSQSAGFVPLGELKHVRKPVYVDVADAGDLENGVPRAVQIGELPLLLVRVGGDLHALHNRCGESPLPLEFSAVEGHTLVCSWHGCRYDVRTGAPEDGGPDRVGVFPVREDSGRVQVAVATEPLAEAEA